MLEARDWMVARDGIEPGPTEFATNVLAPDCEAGKDFGAEVSLGITTSRIARSEHSSTVSLESSRWNGPDARASNDLVDEYSSNVIHSHVNRSPCWAADGADRMDWPSATGLTAKVVLVERIEPAGTVGTITFWSRLFLLLGENVPGPPLRSHEMARAHCRDGSRGGR